VRQRTAVINEVHALYAKRNIDPGMLFHRLRPTAFRVEELSGYGARIVEEDAELLAFFNRQLRGLDNELKKIAEEEAECKRLMTIPGVGPLSSFFLIYCTATTERFSKAKKLSSYFGLAPKVRQSGEREKHGHITKEGNRMVRALLIQAALWHIRIGKGDARKHYLGVLKRRGKQIARVAAANKLLGIMFHMMKERIDYQEFLRRGGNAQWARKGDWS